MNPLVAVIESRRLSLALSVVCVAVFVLLEAYAVSRVLAHPSSPPVISAVDASTNRTGWVTIRDAELDCTRAVRGETGRWIIVPLRAAGPRELVVHEERACGQGPLALTGVIYPMQGEQLERVRRRGLRFRAGAEPYAFCLTCGPSSERTGAIVMGVFLALSICLYPLLSLARRRLQSR